MRRFAIILAMAMTIAMTLAASPASAAEEWNDGRDDQHWNNDWDDVCDDGWNDCDFDWDDVCDDHWNDCEDEVEVVFVPVPVGFWSFDPFWGWFWVDDCGYDWDGPVTPLDCLD
jgi:hypothetical protein